jgi:hypothetical protein
MQVPTSKRVSSLGLQRLHKRPSQPQCFLGEQLGLNYLHEKRLGMPIIKRPPPTPPSATPTSATSPRHRRSDEAARALAPVIAEIQKAGHHGVAEIAKCLNERGLRASSGGPYSYETTRKRLKAIERLGLGPGPRTASQALSARHDKQRAAEAIKWTAIRERREREHPDWDV